MGGSQEQPPQQPATLAKSLQSQYDPGGLQTHAPLTHWPVELYPYMSTNAQGVRSWACTQVPLLLQVWHVAHGVPPGPAQP